MFPSFGFDARAMHDRSPWKQDYLLIFNTGCPHQADTPCEGCWRERMHVYVAGQVTT
jgi:hypothetical protein